MRGEGNPMWKGNKVGYSGLHKWVKRYKGPPKICKMCGRIKDNPFSIHWANINHQYKRKLEDFISLCYFCHRQYDKTLDSLVG